MRRTEQSAGSPEPRRLRDEEPFVTIRANPRRFGWGIPVVVVLSAGAALPLIDRSQSLAVAVQLGIQTVGFIGLYLPAARRRWRDEEGRDREAQHRG